jgi:hypothetical protein
MLDEASPLASSGGVAAVEAAAPPAVTMAGD